MARQRRPYTLEFKQEAVRRVQERGSRPRRWPATWDSTAASSARESRRPTRDGEVIVIDGRARRVHVPWLPVDTSRRWVDVSDPACVLDLDRETLCATFTTSRGSVSARGECVRVLLAYAQARSDEPPDEG